MTDQPTSPPAGWYDDPAGSDQLRWWDGQAWTAHTNQETAAPGATVGPGPGAGSAAGSQGSGTPGADLPWWAQTGDGKPPSWWEEGGQAGGGAWDANDAVGDRRGPGDPSTFGVPGARPESQAAPVAGPYSATRSVHTVGRADGAIRALVLGLVSLVCCGLIVGPFAIYEGVQVRYRVRTSNGRLSGDGFGVAAIILGSVALLLNLVYLYMVATGKYSVTSTGSGGSTGR